MKIVKFSINRPVTVTMFMVAAIIFGYVAFDRLPINLLPDISYPTLTIRTEYAGTAPG
jgi:HAE1 family hydrophobic/amphiphilic exporter-1